MPSFHPLPVARRFLACLALAGLMACAHHVVPPPVSPIPLPDLVTSVFLLGDAGSAHVAPDPNLMELTRQATESPRGSVIVFLGDNLYPRGLPAEDDPGRAEAERRLEVQLDVARVSQRRVIFLAGNHDWERWGKGGEGAIVRVSDFLRERVKGLSRQLPDSACPGPVVQDIGTAVRLVLIDTQWWLQSHEKPYGPNSYCEAKTEDDVVAGLKVALATAGERHVIVAGHHPLESGGEHGGYWSIGKWIFPLRDVKSWLWVPLPIIGAIYPLARMNGITSQDLSGSRNEHMRAEFAAAFAEHPPLLYAAGHDHNLQVFRGPDAKFSIVSGSGIIDHQEAVKYKDNTLYAARKPGFMRFDVDRTGRVRLSVHVIDKEGPREAFAMDLTEGQ